MKRLSTIIGSCLLSLLLTLYPAISEAQTCGCAGAPLLSAQSISSTSGGNLLLGLTYEFNNIDDLVQGTSELENRSVRRSTETTLLEVHYGITDRITASSTFTFINKSRTTGLQNPGSPNEVETRGIGDALVMLKYVLHKNTIRSQYQLAVGGGAKIPFGSFSQTANGLQLNADMQAGTGAWDGVLWSYLSKTFAPHTTLNLFWTNSFRLTGKADRFSNTDDSYRFGNEFVSTLGAGNKLVGNLSYVMRVQYRQIGSSERNGLDLPNTGGEWINLNPALSYRLADKVTVRAGGEIPLYRNLKGTQSSTSYSISGSVFYNFGGSTIF